MRGLCLKEFDKLFAVADPRGYCFFLDEVYMCNNIVFVWGVGVFT